MKIKVTTDSAADWNQEDHALLEKFGIDVIPFSVVLGEKTYSDGVDIFPKDLFAYVDETGVLPTTSAVTLVDFEEKFRALREEYDAVIHISLSSGLSSCYQNACIAAEEIGCVYVVDSLSLSTGIALIAIAARTMADEGKMSPEEIADACRALAQKTDVSFVLPRLDYMHKGGRCSAVTMFGANLLKLRPVLEMKDGKLGVCGKYRGPIKAVRKQYIADRLAGKEVDGSRIFFTTTSSSDPDFIREGVEELKATNLFKEINVTTAGATISSHCGPDCFGILFIRK